MKKIIHISLIVCLTLFLCQCDKSRSAQDLQKDLEQQRNAKIQAENKEAWERARNIQFSDSDFLRTKEPMSDQAIAPYDYHTGVVGDKAYNQRVYVIAVERVKKHLRVENNQLVINLKSGAEVNIAEDLFEYIQDLIKDWNQWIREGKYEIIKTDEGYYDIAFIEKTEK